MLKVVSLFSGCGGMDIGFEGDFYCLKKSINTIIHPDWIKQENGEWVLLAPTIFNTVFANDIRSDAKLAWSNFFSKKKGNTSDIYHLGSIVDLVKQAKQGKNIFPQNIDIVTGGFPCQDFSIAGKRLGFASQKSHTGHKLDSEEPSIESRGQLYMWMRDVISLTKPKLFIAENVKGLTNLADVKHVIEKIFRMQPTEVILSYQREYYMLLIMEFLNQEVASSFLGLRKVRCANKPLLRSLANLYHLNMIRTLPQLTEKGIYPMLLAQTHLPNWKNLIQAMTHHNKSILKPNTWELIVKVRQKLN